MALFSYKGVDYDTPAYPIQNDPSATSLDATKIPTGQTVANYTDNLFMKKGTDYVTAGQRENTTLGTKATCEGTNTTASGANAHAEGELTRATADNTHAEGMYSAATYRYAHAEGASTTSSGYGSHSEGCETTASGDQSHAEGESSKATHADSHAEGYHTKTGAMYQHVQGKYNEGKATTVFEIGWGTDNNNRKNILEVDTDGNVVTPGTISANGGCILPTTAGTAVNSMWIEY